MYVCKQICLAFPEGPCSGLSPLSGPLGGDSATGDTEQTPEGVWTELTQQARDYCL